MNTQKNIKYLSQSADKKTKIQFDCLKKRVKIWHNGDTLWDETSHQRQISGAERHKQKSLGAHFILVGRPPHNLLVLTRTWRAARAEAVMVQSRVAESG